MMVTNKLLEKYHFKKHEKFEEELVVDFIINKDNVSLPNKYAFDLDECYWYSPNISSSYVEAIYYYRGEKIDTKPLTRESIDGSFFKTSKVIPSKEAKLMYRIVFMLSFFNNFDKFGQNKCTRRYFYERLYIIRLCCGYGSRRFNCC